MGGCAGLTALYYKFGEKKEDKTTVSHTKIKSDKKNCTAARLVSVCMYYITHLANECIQCTLTAHSSQIFIFILKRSCYKKIKNKSLSRGNEREKKRKRKKRKRNTSKERGSKTRKKMSIVWKSAIR